MVTYAVYASGIDRDTLLGYATGNREDVSAYFEEKQDYGLKIEEIKPLHIPSGYALRKSSLMAEKYRAERELKEINQKIKGSE